MSQSARVAAPILLAAAAILSAIFVIPPLFSSDPIEPSEPTSQPRENASSEQHATMLPHLEPASSQGESPDTETLETSRFEQVGDRRFEVTPEGVRIEVGTPEQYRQPYLSDQELHQILADGTQIYGEVPFEVRQPDGTMAIQTATIEVQPTDPVPIGD